MKIPLIICVLVAGLAHESLAADAETELKALSQQWMDAYVKADTAFLKNVEADEWTLVEPDGRKITKAQDIKEVEDKTFVAKSHAMSDVKVRMLGENYAAVSGLSKLAGTFKGKDFDGNYRFLDVFEKKDGKWRAIISQVTEIDEDDD